MINVIVEDILLTLFARTESLRLRLGSDARLGVVITQTLILFHHFIDRFVSDISRQERFNV
jgi:hypothetical protein